MTRLTFRAALGALLMALVLPACAPAEGGERGPCYPNSTCNEGLACLSNICVRRGGDAATSTDGSDAIATRDSAPASDSGAASDTVAAPDTLAPIDGGSPVDAAPRDTGSVDTGPPLPPTFEGDVLPMIRRSCGSTDAACHARNVYNANSMFGCRGWLSLDERSLGATYNSGPNAGRPTGCPDRTLYERLTSDACQECSARRMPLVAPGNPDGSYFYRKIGTGPYCPFPFDTMASARMPMGGTLPPADIDMVRRWIAAGAPRAM